MANWRSRKIALALLTAATLALAGCGAGSETASKNATEVACDFEPPAEPVTINVLAYSSPAIDAFTNTMVKSCTREGVTLKHDPIDFGGQYTKTPITLSSPKGTYDILEFYSGEVAQFASMDQILPLDEYFEKYKEQFDLDGLDPTMLEGMSYDGKLYALPTQSNVGMMVYREDVLDELGLDVPTTWAELADVAQAIQDSGTMDYPVALVASDPNTLYESTLGSQGMSYVDTETNTPTFDTPEAERALSVLVDMLPYMDPQVSTFDSPRVQQQLYSGKAAIAIKFSGSIADLLDPANSPYAEDFAVASPPSVEPGGGASSTISVDGWALAANSDVDPELMFQLIAASVSEEASVGAMPYAFPARTSVITDERLPYAQAVKDTVANGASPAAPYWWFTAMENASWTPFLKALRGEMSVEDALAAAQAAGVTAIEDHG